MNIREKFFMKKTTGTGVIDSSCGGEKSKALWSNKKANDKLSETRKLR